MGTSAGITRLRMIAVCGLYALSGLTHTVHAQEAVLALAPKEPSAGEVYGPADPVTAPAPEQSRSYSSFGDQVGAVKWEFAAIIGYYTLINSKKLSDEPQWPHFHKEGWFGKSTANVGVDKVAHAYSAYVVSELLHARLRRKTGGAQGTPLTAAALGLASTLYSELWDSIEPSAGWSWEDVAFDAAGASFSALRNNIPGLDRKLDFRLMIVPNDDIFTREGKRHFEQQRYFFALKLGGFRQFERGPLRFVELHAGYYGKDFALEDRANGIRPKRRVFFGVGINMRELLFKDPSTRAGRAAGEVLDYWQPPYTAIHAPVTD